jgi:DNA recombination protein RmuC
MLSLVLMLIIILLLGAIFWMVRKQAEPVPVAPPDDRPLLLLQSQIAELSRTLDSRIGESSRQMNESSRAQYSESMKIIRDVTERLGKLDETNRQVVGFADQLRSLQDILKNPKQRGILGEYYLETLLKNVLSPGSYQMQYAFNNGEIVDAAVFVREKIIPIDSKFSLENYNRMVEEHEPTEKARLEKLFINDLKLRIQETAKYIRPAEGTMDFAFMFIPHEAIYYDLLVNKIGAVAGVAGDDNQSMIERAAGKYKVIIVSPTSFLAYLQTVLQALKALQIEETAKDVIKRVEELGMHLKKYEEYHGKLGTSLSTVVNHFNASAKELKKVDKDVLRVTGAAPGLEISLIDKPDLEE